MQEKGTFPKNTLVLWILLINGFIVIGLNWYFSQSETSIQATASDRNEGVIMATGPVFVQVNMVNGSNMTYSALEALYTLDQNSGRLTAGVLARESQNFQGLYLADLNAGLASVLSQGGNKTLMPQHPRYSMVTGEISIPNRAGASWQMPQGVVYVHELNTGYVMVYTIPWTSDWKNGVPNQGEMVLWTAYRFTAPFNAGM